MICLFSLRNIGLLILYRYNIPVESVNYSGIYQNLTHLLRNLRKSSLNQYS